jgi:hypothetical protein
MEIKPPFIKRLKARFLREKIPFAAKSDVNWKRVTNCILGSVGIGILVMLFLPAPKQMETSFHEKLESGNSVPPEGRPAQDPTQQALDQLNQNASPSPPSRLPQGGGGGVQGADRSASMILARDGQDSKTQIPAGSRIAVRLREKATVSTTGMPVIGIVTRDYVHEDTVAIPLGSKLFGTVSFDENSDRARVEWRAVELADRRERQLAAVSVGVDGQVGVEGNVHSNAVQNTVGATLTRFIGAYAEGSMQRGALGGNPGGSDNGLRNAVADTAKDRADAFAESLKKEKRWIELNPGTEFFAVLTSNFVFRDPGATYGR